MHKDLDKIISDIAIPIEDQRFADLAFQELFAGKQLELENEKDNLKKIILNDYAELSALLDESAIQESCSVRNNLKARALATILINDAGDLDQALLSKAITILKSHLYVLGPERQFDGIRNQHILNILTALKESKQLAIQLKLISKPHMHKFADQLIRDTLELPSKTSITDTHARRAVLSAWLCYLRQNVGSCFATAPAIIIHQEQSITFLKDLQELLSTGRLKGHLAALNIPSL